MSLLSNLKKQRQAQVEKATKSMESGGRGNSEKKGDSRFWKLTPDEQGNAAAIIRFLPPVHDGDEMPWVKVDKYAFKGPTGKWYVNNSRRTIGESDPVYDLNSREWNEDGSEEAKKRCSGRKIQPKHIFNILVIKDINNPDNEGKVFLFEAGKQIFNWIQEQAKPEDDPLEEPKDPVYVWDLWEGANFRFKAYTEAPYLKYDKSTFDSKSELFPEDDAKKEEILKQCHNLAQFVAADQFKSYDELQKELDRALGNGAAQAPAKTEKKIDLEEKAPAQKKAPKQEAQKAEAAPAGDDDDESLAYFKSLIGD